MHVTINGKPEEISAMTILDVLKHKEIDPKMVAVELNTKLVERDQLDAISLNEGDNLEFLFYMGGGL